MTWKRLFPYLVTKGSKVINKVNDYVWLRPLDARQSLTLHVLIIVNAMSTQYFVAFFPLDAPFVICFTFAFPKMFWACSGC
jgi:hypothetical protein